MIRDTIRRMQAEECRVAAWQTAIKVGDDLLNRGEGIACTPEALDDIAQNAIGTMHSGTPMDADALPQSATAQLKLAPKARGGSESQMSM